MRTAEQTIDPEAVVREFQQPLLGYLRRYVGNPAVADDLLQETWMRMARGLDSFAGHSSVKTWLFAIASHVAADYVRRPVNKLQLVNLDEAEDIIDPAQEIGDKVIADEMSDCVRGVIDILPDAYRSTLLLHDLQGFSLDQTAEIAGSALGATKIRLHRARHRLRAALDQQCDFYHSRQGAFRCDRK